MERLVRTDDPARRWALRWLRLVGVAILGGAILAALVHSSGVLSELLSLAAGALGALVLAGAIWIRGGYSLSQRPDYAESGWSALHSELARSRRHERQFALIGIPADVWSSPSADLTERTALGLSVAASLHAVLRTPDRAWLDGSSLHVLLTDCDRSQAEAFLQRARSRMPQLFPVDRVKLAVFPDHGITVGALLAVLQQADPEQNAEGQRAPEGVTT